MATLKSTLSISNVIEPVWENEKRIPIRAIWEIAALAGNVHPSRENVKRKKDEDLIWRAGYSQILRRMIDVLKPTTARSVDHINYDPALPFNASVQAERPKHRQIRVDVLSACNFLAGRYGVDKLPEGMRSMFQNLESNAVRNSAQVDSTIARIETIEKSTGGKDQTKANETKKSLLLSTVLVAIASDLWGSGTIENETTLEVDIQAMLDKHKLTTIHGLKLVFVLEAIRDGKKYIEQKKG